MLQIVAIAGLVLLTAITVIVVIASRRPNEFRVSRSQRMQATPGRIYPLIADFTAWARWSPYDKRDPNMRRKISSAAQGIGAVYEWQGNRKAGAGRMEILDVVEPAGGAAAKIAIRLDIQAPFEAHNIVEFIIEPVGTDGSDVTWAMRAPFPFASKVMSLFLNLDKMIGNDFAEGLTALKAVAEEK